MLRSFQTQFIRKATAPGIHTACLSVPRGNGKSWLGGHLLARVMTPGDALFVAGAESVLCAASIEQARIPFRFARAILEPEGGYRFLDSATRAGIVHLETNTRIRVLGSNGKTAMGLVNCPLALCDEPGAWETRGGELLYDAIQTAQGKPGSPLRAVYIGTLAPATGGWWHQIVEGGSGGSVYVQALRGDPSKWEEWAEIRRCNPLVNISPEFKAKLVEERDAARRDSRLKARFLSYRLNCPTADEAVMLLTVDDWQRALTRRVPERAGRPLVGMDLGGGRAWSAAAAIWETGRVEALAVAPGIPDLEAQERRDLVPSGTYGHLLEAGALQVAEGLRVPPVPLLFEAVNRHWGQPEAIFCDTFRGPELLDAAGGVPVVTRRARWSECAEDVRSLRKIALDGPLAVAEPSRNLLSASLAVARVKNDDQGSTRMVKKDPSNNTGRDDVAAALVLAAGAFERAAVLPASGGAYLGIIG